MRFIHAAREFNQEHGTCLRTSRSSPSLTVMPCSFARRTRRYFLARRARPRPLHATSRVRYVDYGTPETRLVAARADAVWVGWGFVAEHAEFADLCREMGIVFIGPDGDVMRRLGDKISSKRLAEQAQITGRGPGAAARWIRWHEARTMRSGLATPSDQGDGRRRGPRHSARGFRRANSAGFERPRSDAFKAFGDPTVFLEQVVTGARHVEVQIIADHFGTTWAAGSRDCTIQRRTRRSGGGTVAALSARTGPGVAPGGGRVEPGSRLPQCRHRRISVRAGISNVSCFMEMNTRLRSNIR